MAQTIANCPGIGEHVEKFDRRWIIDAITPTYNNVHGQNGLVFTNFFKPPGLNMLRFHSLTNMGGEDIRARQVKEGVDLVDRAGTSRSEIVKSIKKVAEIVADIAHASGE